MAAIKERVMWSCTQCGHHQRQWAGVCPVCKEWNTLVEEREVKEAPARFSAPGAIQQGPVIVGDVKLGLTSRFTTGFGELDRLLGGGIVTGSFTLLGGDPGIGKSTLMLQLCARLAQSGKKVLYVSGEESLEQISGRAHRLGLEKSAILLLSETSFTIIKHQIEKLKPDFVVLDSIQIVYKPDLPSFPGSVGQVKEIALECMHLAKGMGLSILAIGHVTKSGELAGPRVLEHIVDVVLEFEGDSKEGYRTVRSVKNRFGPTDEIALFHMVESGLVEVPNPSQFFLKERVRNISGSAIVATLEGSRPILIEIQALVAPSAFSSASRKGTGIDPNRLALLLAVMEKRVGFHFHALDVFVSVVGGMRVVEPAIDLGVLIAIASSFKNVPVDPDTIVIGEVGLGGELRNVPRIEQRLKEALQMGFSRCYLPAKNLSQLSSSWKGGLELIGVDLVEDVIDRLLGA